MDSNLRRYNAHLPFEVLGVIFHYYAEEETIVYPLETLLLVSRPWNEAAIGHCTLWNHLNMYIGHIPSSEIWKVRLPLRLARCGPTTPLYIDIRNEVPYTMSAMALYLHGTDSDDSLYHYEAPLGCIKCRDAGTNSTCFIAAWRCIEEAWRLLSGPNGEICARWRHFQFDAYHGATAFELAKALSYNTPNLETLIFRNVRPIPNAFAGINPLPDTKLLKAITVVNCKLPFLPKLDDILQATIGWEEEESNNVTEVFCLVDAVKLQRLVLLLPPNKNATLPPRLPDLTSLEIVCGHLPTSIWECKIPRLSELKISLTRLFGISSLFTNRTVLPETLRQVTITWELNIYSLGHVLLGDLEDILPFFSQFDSIRVHGKMLSVIIRILSKAATSSALMCGKHLFNEDKGTAVGFEGDEDVGWFERLASDWELIPPSLPEPEFFARFGSPCGTIVLTSTSSKVTEACN